MPTERVVHIIDDDEAVRQSLAFLLGTAQISTRTYESAMAFLANAAEIEPGCIITDVRMPDVDGLELLRRIQHLGLGLPVIVITGHGDIPLAIEAMKSGAAHLLEKPFDDEDMLAAVRSALNEREGDPARAAERVKIRSRIAQLSNRELHVLRGLVAGNSNTSIASDLRISSRTVELDRANIMTKMQAASLFELVRMALNAGDWDEPS